MRRLLLLLLIVALAGCAVVLPQSSTVTPTVSAQQYLPVVLNGYPPQLQYGPVGVGGAPFSLDVDWYYHWSISPAESDPRFVRMIWCLDDWHLLIYEPQVIKAAAADRTGGVRGRVWLVLNEPDYMRPLAQCGGYRLTGDPFDPHNQAPYIWEAPEETAVRFSAMYDLIKLHDPSARVFTGGFAHPGEAATQDWWLRFVDTLRLRGELYKIEGVHVHGYPDGCGPKPLFETLEEWYANYHVGVGLRDCPIWITETGTGCGQWEQFDPGAWIEVRDEVMLPFQEWFAGQNDYEAAAWFVSWWDSPKGFTFSCDFLIDARQTPAVLTPLGEAWEQ